MAILSRPSGANLGRCIPPAACQGVGGTMLPKFPRNVKRGMDSQGIGAGSKPEGKFFERQCYVGVVRVGSVSARRGAQ